MTKLPSFDPVATIFLDWETAYDPASGYTLSKMTAESYIRDPRFEGIGISVKVNNEKTIWMEEWDFREWAKTVPWEKCVVVAHNGSGFDFLILSHHYGIKAGLWVCTMQLARALHGTTIGGSLAKLMAHYDCGVKGDEVVKAMGKRRKDFTQEEWLRYGDYSINDTEGCRGIFLKVSENFPEIELWLADQTSRFFTEPKLILDEPLLQNFLVEERIRKAGLLERISKDRSIVASSDKFAQMLIDLGEDPPTKYSEKKSATARLKDPDAEPVYTWAFAKTDPGMQALLESEKDEVRWAAEARIAVKSTLNETRSERLLAMGKGGRLLPVQLNYWGAHTGRWSGAGRMNFQNLGRVLKKDPKSGVLKRSLLAPKGYMVVAADSGQIEARGAGWLAEQEDLVEAFAQGRDIYTEFASEDIYHTQIDKTTPEGEQARYIAKTAVLGLCYGLGYIKFSIAMLSGSKGPPVQFTMKDVEAMGVDLNRFIDDERKMDKVQQIPSRLSLEDLTIHCAVSDKIVQVYRKKFKKIPALWKFMTHVLEAMEAGEAATFGPGEVLSTTRHGIVLPNGMTLRYPGLEKSEDGGYSYLGEHKQRQFLHGGLMVENLVQAMARNIVAEQMLNIRVKYGRIAALMAHDEITYVEPEHEAPMFAYQLVNEMKVRPSWAPGWPLSAEGGWGPSYGTVSKDIK